jgi:hypothetical protein
MLIRWFILRLCATRAELRLVLRTFRALRDRDPSGTTTRLTDDRRITRRPRLALLLAVLFVHAERPQLFAAAVLMVPAVTILLVIRLVQIVL